jgi:flagellar motility protein MotE (MotC chaperone)
MTNRTSTYSPTAQSRALGKRQRLAELKELRNENEALRAELAEAKAENEELNKRRQNSIVNSVELEKKNKALKKELVETVNELGEVVRRLRAEKS